MKFHDLLDKIRADKDGGLFSLQVIFNRHILAIQQLKVEGYNYKIINEHLNIGLTDLHFHSLMKRARKKKVHKPNKTSEQHKETTDTTLLAKPKNNVPKSEIVDTVSDKEWHNINVRSPYLINRLNGLNIHPNEVKEWNCVNELMVTKRMSEYNTRNT